MYENIVITKKKPYKAINLFCCSALLPISHIIGTGVYNQFPGQPFSRCSHVGDINSYATTYRFISSFLSNRIQGTGCVLFL